MARRATRPAIISDDVDRFIERMFVVVLVLFGVGMVFIQAWRWTR